MSIGLVVVVLLFVIGGLLYQHHENSTNITPTMKSVFRDSLAKEWESVRGTLQMSDDSLLLGFMADYKPSGEVTRLIWEFGEPTGNDMYKVYSVWKDPGETQYHLSTNENQKITTYETLLKATELNRLLTPDVWKAMTPKEQSTSYRLQLTSMEPIQQAGTSPNGLFDIKDGQITAHSKSKGGYILDVERVVRNEEANTDTSYSPTRYILVYPQ